MLALVFGMVLPWLLIALGAWLGYQLLRQNGRILLRLDSIEKQLRPHGGAPRRGGGGLPVGDAGGRGGGGRGPPRWTRRPRISSCRPSRGYATSFPTSAASRCCSSSSI